MLQINIGLSFQNRSVMTLINIQSRDGEIFPVSENIARQFGTIRTMLENLDDVNISRDSSLLPLPNVDSETLRILIDWAKFQVSEKQHPENLFLLPKTGLERFMLEPDMVMKVVWAADYLDIEPLLDIGCKVIGSLITGKSSDEMKKSLKIDIETPTQ